MITDKLTTFAKATALNTGAAGRYLVGDVIDLQNHSDIGTSTNLWLYVSVDTAATGGGTSKLQIELVSDDSPSIATDGSATVHYASDVFPVADLGAGKTLCKVRIPAEGQTYERYLGILQVTSGAAFSAGKINALLTPNATSWQAYPDNNH